MVEMGDPKLGFRAVAVYIKRRAKTRFAEFKRFFGSVVQGATDYLVDYR